MTTSEGTVQPSEVLCIIPALNESEVISNVIGPLVSIGYRVLLIDDGSRDSTADIARTSGAEVISHPINLGQGASLETGFEAVRRGLLTATYVATFDADGQHSAEDLAIMLKAFQSDPHLQVALGSRFLQNSTQVPRLKRILLPLSAKLARLTLGLTLTDRNNGMRMFRADALADVRITVPGYGHADEILHAIRRAKLRYTEVPVRIVYTDYSKGKGQPLINAVRILFDQMLG